MFNCKIGLALALGSSIILVLLQPALSVVFCYVETDLDKSSLTGTAPPGQGTHNGLQPSGSGQLPKSKMRCEYKRVSDPVLFGVSAVASFLAYSLTAYLGYA